MKEPLKDQITKHFQQFNLTGKQIQSLEKIQKKSRNDHETLSFKKNLFIIPVLLFCFLITISYFWSHYSPSPMDLSKLPKEIAYHHSKHMEPEINTHSLGELKSFLSKLDFSLIKSEMLPSDQWEILGGRYCSLQGRLVAQIKIRNKLKHSEATLYQIGLPEGFEGFHGIHKTSHLGVKVKMWKEQGLFLGIAEDNIAQNK